MDGWVVIGTKIDKTGFEKGVSNLEKEGADIDKSLSSKFGNLLEKMSNRMTSALSKAVDKMGQFGQKGVRVISTLLKGVISLGSALFGVVGILGGLGALAIGAFILTKALQKANGKTEQLKANLSYVGFVASKIFENLLQPAIDKTTGAVNGLVGALYKAVVYVGYILGKWFNVDVFKGTGAKDYAKAMEEASKSTKKTAKATKQIKKDLMGFDEVNKLTEDTKTGGNKDDKITMPNLPSTKSILGDLPDWVKWIANNKDKILPILGTLLAILTFSKVISWLKPLTSFFNIFTGSGAGTIAKALGSSGGGGLLGTLGTAGAIGGAIIAEATAWGLFLGKYTKEMDETYTTVNNIIKRGTEYNKEFVKTTNDVTTLNNDLNYRRQQGNKLLKEANNLGIMGLGVKKKYFDVLKATITQQDNIILKEVDLYKNGKLTNDEKKKTIEKIKEQIKYNDEIAKKLEKNKQDTTYIKDMNTKYRDILKEIDGNVNNISRDYSKIAPQVDTANNKTKPMAKNTKDIADNTKAGYNNLEKFNEVKVSDKNVKIKVDADTTKANSSLSTFISGIGKKISKAFEKIDLSGFGEKIGKSLQKLFPDIKLPSLSKIKSFFAREGGIINNPGKGVAVTSNIIGGEAGPEAILPLDDTTMNRLGLAIARHMNVNLTNITEMNGRTISRELKKITNENTFSYNG